MAELSIDQQKALALARARRRASEQQPSMAGDIAKSAASGVAQGAMDLIGLPGTIGDAFNAGVTKATNSIANNVFGYEGEYTKGPPNSSPLSGSALRGYASDATGGATEYKPQTTAGEYAQTAGAFVPGAVALGGGGSVAGNALRFGVVPGVTSEAAGQAAEKFAPQLEPYARIAGALAGPALVSGAERLITPMPIGPERAAMNQTLRNEGVDLTAGQSTGNTTLKNIESEIGGGAAANFMDRQGEQFTRAALSRAGINADRATPEVIDNAFTRIGQQFDDLAARNNLIPDPQLGQDLGNALREYNGSVAQSARAPGVQDMVADIAARAAQGPIDGNFYQRTSSRLARLARGAGNDPERRMALQGIRDSLDDAMERSLAANNPADLGGWQEARTQYRNMLVLEKAATGAGENAALGLISPSQLRNATVQQSRRAFARGQGDFSELARAGEAAMKPLPNSGTAGRTAARNLFQGAPAVIGSAVGGSTGGIPGAALGALIGGAAPYAAGRALLSRPVRAYLSNQLVQPTNLTDPRNLAVIEALLGRQGQIQGQ